MCSRATVHQSPRRRVSYTCTRDVRSHGGFQRRCSWRTSVAVTRSVRKYIPLTLYTTMPPRTNRKTQGASSITCPSYAAMLAVLIITPRWPPSSALFSIILLEVHVACMCACMRVKGRGLLETDNNMLFRQFSPENGAKHMLI